MRDRSIVYGWFRGNIYGIPGDLQSRLGDLSLRVHDGG